MIIVMRGSATQQEVDAVRARLEEVGYAIHLSQGQQRTLMGAVGDVAVNKERMMEQLSLMPGVEQVVPILKPYKLASREFHPDRTVIDVAGVPIGGREMVVMAGPAPGGCPGQIPPP